MSFPIFRVITTCVLLVTERKMNTHMNTYTYKCSNTYNTYTASLIKTYFVGCDMVKDYICNHVIHGQLLSSYFGIQCEDKSSVKNHEDSIGYYHQNATNFLLIVSDEAYNHINNLNILITVFIINGTSYSIICFTSSRHYSPL